MNISALNTLSTYDALGTPASRSTGTSANPEPDFPFLTASDIAVLERATGTSSFSELSAAAPDTLQHFNTGLQKGTITGDLAQYLPTSFLTTSDVQYLEKVTGTGSLIAALKSSYDANMLGMSIASDRQDGSLTGDISASYLDGILAASQQLEDEGSYGHIASSSFLKQAIAEIQSDPNNVNGTTVSASA